MNIIKGYPAKIIILLTVCIAGCSVHPLTLEREFNIVSEQKELDIGRAAHPQIIQQFGFYHNTELQRYINEVGQKLVKVCRRRDITYHFTLLDDKIENAFAIPGGYIYITRGLLALLNSEAELAGVLAHEIGHVVGKDSATLMSQSMLAQFATLAGVAGAATSSGSGSDLLMATNQLFNSIMLGFSRKKEHLADEQGVEYMFEAGYDPMQITSFMRSLSYKSQGPTGIQQYLVTHPYIFDRISRVEAKCKVVLTMRDTMGQIQNINKKKKKGLVLAEKYKSYLDGLAYGPKDNLRHIKIYTVKKGDSFLLIAKKNLGSTMEAKKIAGLNGMPVNAQLIPGAKIKIIY